MNRCQFCDEHCDGDVCGRCSRVALRQPSGVYGSTDEALRYLPPSRFLATMDPDGNPDPDRYEVHPW
jgi:hypothetical protein